jgi:thiol-disulfide isomerase/thioredoxin
MKSYVIAVLFLIPTWLAAQELNKVIADKNSGKEILIGKCNRDALTTDVFSMYYEKGYAAYAPDENVVRQLSKLRKGVDVVVVMGSWCHDSKEQVPRFYKILDDVGVKDSKIELICVDSEKSGGEADVSFLDIQRVPTFIFYKKGREIGRIVETPTSTLEKDMLLIFTMGFSN